MRPLLLLTTLLCVLCAALAETQRNADMVKLCGRSFLRAVVYACGGSRWKRVTEEEALQSSEYRGSFQMHHYGGLQVSALVLT